MVVVVQARRLLRRLLNRRPPRLALELVRRGVVLLLLRLLPRGGRSGA